MSGKGKRIKKDKSSLPVRRQGEKLNHFFPTSLLPGKISARTLTLTLHPFMNILLAAATAKEIEPFFEYYRNTKRLQDIDVLITGIGLTSTTYHLLKQIQLKNLLF